MAKTRTKVYIGGIEYALAGEESAEYIRKVAAHVDEKMQEAKRATFGLNNEMLSVLAAINIADEYLKLKDEMEKLSCQLEELKEMNEEKENLCEEYKKPSNTFKRTFDGFK